MIVYADDIILQDCYAQESSQFQETSPKFIPVCYRCVTSEDFIHRVTNLTCVLFLSLRHGCWSVVGLNCERYLRNFFQFVIIAFHLRISPRYQFVVCFFRAWGMVVCADGVILQDVTEIYLRYIWGFHPPRYQFDRCSFCS